MVSYYIKHEKIKRLLKYIILWCTTVLSVQYYSNNLTNNNIFIIGFIVTSIFVILEIFCPTIYINNN